MITERDYLSIGEVLAMLLEEFPDVTISKIRFLESQGLIEPERTPSGYRKFTNAEVDRLRFILREQKANFLPLRVIKDRLEDDSQDISRDIEVIGDAVSTASHPAARASVPRPITEAVAPNPEMHDAKIAAAAAKELRKQALKHADKTESVPRDQLLQQVDIDSTVLKELEAAGLVSGHDVGDTTFFDPHSANIARTAARFLEMGIDIRHLRGWKTSAERELSLFEQRILPLLRQRNPAARDEAIEMLAEFMELGTQLRESLLMRDISRLTEPRG